ncbi:hypothetical protein RRG08_038472 [Elysia crispata]|uniref:Uncharacterized protein n=1 Tax=Elysia crispata TaxID=231223 RepID=A0AAE0XRP2_9GAST|nr:hypothetical protein RRG08_038472 [Elysia crispata]
MLNSDVKGASISRRNSLCGHKLMSGSEVFTARSKEFIMLELIKDFPELKQPPALLNKADPENSRTHHRDQLGSSDNSSKPLGSPFLS